MKSPPIWIAAARLRNRVPTQMRRCIPMYIAFICFILVVLNADMFNVNTKPANLFKRQASSQKPLRAGKGRGASTTFPKKIWQTWKVDPLSFDQRDALTAKTWTAKNPDYRYEVLTDNNDLTWIEQYYGPEGLNRQDIVDFYRNVNATIIKADLLRYLIMYAEGGVYADIDVEALKPVRRWVTDRFDEADVDMVIGVEIDQPQFKDHPILGKKSESFCQWTFMCKPRLPVMLHLVENIMAWLNGLAAQQGVSISDVHLDFDEVISGTGPSAFTAAILQEMNRVSGGHPITWDRFHEMDESKLVSRVLVLDVEAFAAGQGHSDSGNHNARGALVKHHYHASNWPSRHPRFRHPVYGEVERCNWDVDCVRKWDANIEMFKTLPPEEQEERIRQVQQPQLLPGIPAL
ncbi:alpha-1,6-mannosyltransferase Och1 [Coniochaeta ligniaria NRRL 30616]|uniref:Alpha-1,6-mannosyltransferase Och1 n=1 Tax=Coniochaeta ligniaria NRRL 30616 TaxID=1408157 RepID=A0A1J7J7A0_9PEZI|nr:alpha-1,6-mannosyltransferase Och1 [Coniochaeta ligniaria NRRL 30616]